MITPEVPYCAEEESTLPAHPFRIRFARTALPLSTETYYQSYLNGLFRHTYTSPVSMTGPKRERSTTPETKPATAKGSPKKKSPSTKVKGEDGAKDDKARPWTAEEDAALMSGVREVIAYV